MRPEFIIHGSEPGDYALTPQHLDIYPRNGKADTLRIFEWREMGLTLLSGIHRPFSVEQIKNGKNWTPPSERGPFNDNGVFSVQKLDSPDHHLIVHMITNQIDVTWFFDRRKSYMPFRFEYRRKQIREENGRRVGRPVVYETCDVTWSTYGNIYMPSTVSHVGFPDVSFEGQEKYNFSIEWEGINQPLDSSYQNVEEFGLDAGAFLVDQRVQPPNFLGPIGHPTARIPTVDPPPKMQLWVWIAGGSLLFGLAMILIVVWRSKTR